MMMMAVFVAHIHAGILIFARISSGVLSTGSNSTRSDSAYARTAAVRPLLVLQVEGEDKRQSSVDKER